MTSVPVYKNALFENCGVPFVPVVDFNFVENCVIPATPPPTFDCPPPLCPFPEPPPFCPTITDDVVIIATAPVPRTCKTAKTVPTGKVVIAQNDDCKFTIGLDLDIPILMPPCPSIKPRDKNVDVTADYGCKTKAVGKLIVTELPKDDPCDADEPCKFELGLDLDIQLKVPPCPVINGSPVKITAGYGAEPKAEGALTVTAAPKDPCDIDDTCDFDVKLVIDVLLPPPSCPDFISDEEDVKIKAVYGCETKASGKLIFGAKPKINPLDVEEPCEFDVGLIIDIVLEPPACPVIKSSPENVKITASYGCETKTEGKLTVDALPKDLCDAEAPCAFELGLNLDIQLEAPPCPVIKGNPDKVKVTASYGCETKAEGALTVDVAPKDPCAINDPCTFELGLNLDIQLEAPPCPVIKSSPDKVKVTTNYGCEAKTDGAITVTATPKEACDSAAPCEFELGLNLDITIPPPPCPTVTVSTKVDTAAKNISGKVKPPGEVDCTAPECKIEIEIIQPPILTPPEIEALVTTFINTNINTFIETYIEANINTFVELIAPAILVFIGNNVCVPKYKGGKVEICEAATPSGEIIVVGENNEKHCQYQLPPTDFTCPRCYFPGPAGVAACRQWSGTAQDCINAGGIPYNIGPIVGDPDVDAGCSTPFIFPTVCENIAVKDDPAAYCSSRAGTLFNGPCGQIKKCPDQTITAKICLPPKQCVPTYSGGNINVSLAADPASPAAGKISVGAPTQYRSCAFPPGSAGFDFWGRSCVSFAEIEAAGEPPLQFCPDYGGTPKLGELCGASCSEKEVSAELTLPQSLCDVKFETKKSKIEHKDCTYLGVEPFIDIVVDIKPKTGEPGVYTVSVSGEFCSCCDLSAVGEPPTRK